MHIVVISDSHGHIANLRAIVEIVKKGQVDAIIHAGDWNTIESANIILSSGIPLYTVLGNADINPGLISLLKKKAEGFGEKYLIVDIDGRKIGITHKPSNNKIYFEDKNIVTSSELDLIINGHLHSKYESIKTPVKIIRPGALINGINFAVYDTDKRSIKFINTNF